MDTLFEQYLSQNIALSAFAIAQSAIRFKHETNNARGLNLFAALLVPPIVFHRRTAQLFATKQMTDGLFYRAVAEDREAIVGTHARLQDMTPRTLRAIHLGCSAALFSMIRNDNVELFPRMSALPAVVEDALAPESVKTILQAAKRLGHCFATTDLSVICTLLRVRF